MWLIVALFFPFLIEVCWLLYFVVYPQCKITQLEKQDNQKCIFATDGILEQNSVRRTLKCVTTVTCLVMAVPLWCFCGVQWLFIHVIYMKCLGFWLERKDSWKKKFRPSQWWPILDLAHIAVAYILLYNLNYGYHNQTSFHYLFPNGTLFSCLICHRLWEKYELSCDSKISKSLKRSWKDRTGLL